jgi:hypothetical protein
MRLALAFVLCTLPAAAQSPPAGFTPLFNGTDLAGWHGWAIHAKGGTPTDLAKLNDDDRAKKIGEWTEDAKKHWSVKEGVLINDGHGAFLATEKEFGDIELLIDYKTVPKADSGIYLRGCPQIQIWDFTEEAKFKLGADKGSGGLWNNSAGAAGKDPLAKADKPFGEWNRFRVVQVGARTSVWLNDVLVVDHALMENYWDRKKPIPAKGKILLQTHGGEIDWKNIFVREIPAAEANEILAKKANHEGMKKLFNGTDFTGWKGATTGYEIKDGAIHCKPKAGGNLFTEEIFQDFTVNLEFMVPPGGNNGLGLRYPGQGDGAYVGMCELQVLDDTAEKYKNLDARQFHGSAYGMSASHRGYQRPVGEWNFQQVTVKGSTILVELNGTVILDTDLAKVTDYLAKKDHPGKNIPHGHFAFLGHNDPVAFRNIYAIKLNK